MACVRRPLSTKANKSSLGFVEATMLRSWRTSVALSIVKQQRGLASSAALQEVEPQPERTGLGAALERRGFSPNVIARISKRSIKAPEEQLEATLVALESQVGLDRDKIESLLLKTTCLFRVDAVTRLNSVISCFREHHVPLDLVERLVMNRTRWIFSPREERFNTSMENMRLLFPFYKSLNIPQSRWFSQAPHHLHSVHKVQLEECMDFLVKFAGEEGARTIVQRHPGVVHYKVQEQLVPRIERYRAFGLNEEQLVKVICTYPKLLDLSPEDNQSKLAFFQKELGVSDDGISKLLVTFPRFLASGWQEYKRKLDFFVEYCGVGRDKVPMLLKRTPSILTLSLDNHLKPKIDYLATYGITDAYLVQFLMHHAGVLFNKMDKLEARLKRFPQLGFTQEQSLEIIKKQPSLLNYRDEPLEQRITYLKRVSKLQPESYVAFPAYLTYSFDNRVKPRLKFLALLYLNGLARKPFYVPGVLALSEAAFESKFVKAYAGQGLVGAHSTSDQ